jgi:hypothetical protein
MTLPLPPYSPNRFDIVDDVCASLDVVVLWYLILLLLWICYDLLPDACIHVVPC